MQQRSHADEEQLIATIAGQLYGSIHTTEITRSQRPPTNDTRKAAVKEATMVALLIVDSVRDEMRRAILAAEQARASAAMPQLAPTNGNPDEPPRYTAGVNG